MKIRAEVTSRQGTYKITEHGREVLAAFCDPEYTFVIDNLGPNDRVTLTATSSSHGVVRVEMPSGMMEQVS